MAKGTKYLNLDELLGIPASVTFKGKDYEVPEMAVDQFLEVLKMYRDTESIKDETEAITALKNLIVSLVPSFDPKIVGKMSIKQLRALMSFIIEDVQNDGDSQEGNGEGLEAAEKK